MSHSEVVVTCESVMRFCVGSVIAYALTITRSYRCYALVILFRSDVTKNKMLELMQTQEQKC